VSLSCFIWQFIGKQRWLFAVIVALSLAWAVDMLFWPFFLGKMVDVLTANDGERILAWPKLKNLLFVGGAFWVLIEASFRVRDFLQAKAFPKLEADIRMAMFDHVQRHSPNYFNEHFSGSLANKIGDMVLTVSNILRTMVMTFFPSLLICVTTIAIFAELNHLLAGLVTIWITVYGLISWIFTKKCAKYSTIHGEKRSVLVGKIVDSLTNNFVVNLFYRFSFEKDQISSYQLDERKSNATAQLYSAKMFTSLSAVFVIEFFILTFFMISAWMKGAITTGEVVQLFYTIWNLSMVVWIAADAAPQFFQSIGIAKQALTIMNDPQDLGDVISAKNLSINKGEITFENVSFAYGEKKIFTKINLKIEAGERVGLVGYSGAGKSTFVNLILRFFALKEGKITIDGQDISHVSLKSLRSQLALIPQDPMLFHRSLEDNICYGRIECDPSEVVEVAKKAHCDKFIQRCTNGYKSLVGERGTKLSGGEKQRIAIARVMLLKAPILILDEATSALDSITENYIQNSLDELMINRTIIVIAHRLSTLSKMDRILVFDQGQIIEEGTHQALIAQNGHYARMWQAQAGGFLPDAFTNN